MLETDSLSGNRRPAMACYRRRAANLLAVVVAAAPFALATSASGTSGDSVLRVVVTVVPPPSRDVEALLMLESQGQVQDKDSSAATVRRNITIPGQTIVDLPFPGLWTVSISCDGYWAQSQSLSVAGRVEARFNVFRTAEIRFSVGSRRANDGPLPATLNVSFSPASKRTRPKSNEPSAGTTVCGIVAKHVACAVPRSDLDVRVEVEGYAPVYLWGLDLNTHDTVELGTVELTAGGSVSGYVADEDGVFLQGTAISLSAASSPEVTSDPVIQAHVRDLSYQVETDRRGFFQLVGIPQGVYRLEASKVGFSSTRHPETIRISNDEEYALQGALTLLGQASLEIMIDPASDPFGLPWKVTLIDPRSRHPLPFGETSAPGVWNEEGIDRGRYLLLVTASDGSRWLSKLIEVADSEGTLYYQIPVVSIEGTVTADGDPIGDRIVFTSTEAGTQASFDVDEDGGFSGLLSSEGLWEVQVQLRDGRIAVDPVDVRKTPGGRTARLTIEVPNTRVEGDVVDGDGSAVAGAHVFVMDSELVTRSETETDSTGSFSLRGLREGMVFVHAEDHMLTSERHSLQLRDGEPTPTVHLQLRALDTVDGQVVSVGGLPIVGARVVSWVERGSSSLVHLDKAMTDVDGSFSLRVPTSAWRSFVVQAAGYATRLFRQPIEPGSPVLVMMDHDGGTLTVELTGQGKVGVSASRAKVVVVHEGAEMEANSLAWMLDETGFPKEGNDVLVFDGVESGPYDVCTVSGALEDGDATRRCEHRYLPRAGAVVFVAPDRDSADVSRGQ